MGRPITSPQLSMTEAMIRLATLVDQNETGTSTTDVTDVADVPHQQMIPDEWMRYLEISISLFICGAMALFGTANNVVNMIVFYRLGLKDSMSVGLFALSLVDFLLSLAILTDRVLPIWYMFFDTPEIDVQALGLVSTRWLATHLFLCSGCVTTFMSVERCICIILPFKVKRIFTRNRAIFITTFIFVVNVANIVPLYCTVWLEWVSFEHPSANGTSTFSRRLVVMLARNRPTVRTYVRIFSVAVIPIPMMVLLLGSAIWMAIGLTKSNELRMAMTAVTKNDDGQKGDPKSVYKTRRLVKVVLFIAIIYAVCSVPRFFATFMSIFLPEVNQGKKERNLNNLHWLLVRMASSVNASVNIFVYLKVNSSYRNKFKELFKLKSK